MQKKLTQGLQVMLCGLLIVQFSGCGTILYPERRGQKAGHLDAGVVVLDGLGLLLFIIPGVIAFAVDFSNGTIYIPAAERSSLGVRDIKQVKFDPRHATELSIARIIREQTGCAVSWGQPDMQITRLRSTNDMAAQFAQVLTKERYERIALNR